jgi:hypothetical protein
MSTSPRPFRRLAALTAAAALGGLALAGSAVALEAPAITTVTPASPTNASSVTVTFTGVAPDNGGAITYEAGLNGAFAPVGAGTGVVPTPDAGTFSLNVRALEDGAPGPAASQTLTIDRTPPTVTVGLQGTPRNGWFRTLTLDVTCLDDIQIGGAQCDDIPWSNDGEFPLGHAVSVVDAAGNGATGTSPAFNFDNDAPTRPSLIGPGSVVGRQPTFSWSKSTDTGSQMGDYLVQWQREDDYDPDDWQTLATIPEASDYTAPPSTWNRGPLPEFVSLVWRVVAVDRAGNQRASLPNTLLIDPTVPPPPAITGGPSGPTQNTSPTFTWEGTGASFAWSVTAMGSSNALRGGAGTATQADVPSLPDGAYVFRVKQFVVANPSEEAIRSFIVDTVAPSAPTILTRPSFPSLGDAIFTWATEPGAYSRWSVVDGSGNVVVPATDTPVTQAKLPALAENAYVFSVQQIDAAGNVSPATVEPFTVVAPLVAPSPSTNIVTLLPRQNARRLKPKAGKTLFSRTPVLRWSRGPRGTKLFNLQIFRVSIGRNAKTPKVKKVLSVFPKGKAYRVPKRLTRPKTCYVWRVWPYTGREFTPKPLGVSNYCIASQKVLKKKAALISKRKAAKAAARAKIRARSKATLRARARR